jgi:RNA polymerase sigma factor (sigma-70 family)
MNIDEVIAEYEYLIPITLQKLYGNPMKYAKSKNLEYSDLYQFAMIGIWKAAKSYPEKKLGTLRNYIIRNIKWNVQRSIFDYQLNTSIYKSNQPKYANKNYAVPLISMSFTPFEEKDRDFYDIVSCDNITNFPTDYMVDSNLLSDEGYQGILGILTEREKEMVLMRLKDKLSYQEIADKYGVRRQAIGNRFRIMQEKVSRHLGVATV